MKAGPGKIAPERLRQVVRAAHVWYREGGWTVCYHGAKRALRRFDSQREATAYARTLEADRVFVHRRDGTVEEVIYAT